MIIRGSLSGKFREESVGVHFEMLATDEVNKYKFLYLASFKEGDVALTTYAKIEEHLGYEKLVERGIELSLPKLEECFKVLEEELIDETKDLHTIKDGVEIDFRSR